VKLGGNPGRFAACALGLALILAGCATPAPPQRTASLPPSSSPSAPRTEAPPAVLARTADFVIVRLRAGESYATLAGRYLDDPLLADFIAQANGDAPPDAGRVMVVPLKPLNESAVYADGYQTVPILCYHQFTNGRSTDRMIMPRELFIAQMEYLKANKYNVITLAELDGFLKASKPIPRRSVVITIDDGYRSAYDIAYPILKSFGFRATFFVYTDFLSGGRSVTWPAINEMRASGVIDIQSHSKSHASFSPAEGESAQSAAYAARLRAEIDPPGAMLERQLGGKVRSFAYPYGDTSALALRLLGERNYTVAVTVERGGNASFSHPLMLRRDMIYGDATMMDFQRSLRVYTRANLK
jgi:peptidoglycan/xylan/chitin deacetylase (PgdA/CDA1 family)